MARFEYDEIESLVELQGVYDGWSVAILRDGRRMNRWADDEGQPIPGYERRWRMTQEFLDSEGAG